MNIKNILVPVDFSEYSNKALEYALLWGETFGATLTILHVNTVLHERYEKDKLKEEYREIVEEEERELHLLLSEHFNELANHPVEIEYDVISGRSAANSILEYLHAHPFDLVVMGTHGRTGLKHVLLGSVAEKVSRLSPVPVITTHRELHHLEVKNILVPVDFSDYSKQVTRTSVEIARLFEAHLHLLHVFEHPNASQFMWMPENVRSFFDLSSDLQQRLLKALQKYQDPSYDRWTLRVIEEGHAYREIIKYAEENRIDLIIMATRGFNKFEYFWMWGSTTERVVRLAPCPVMSIRSREALEQVA
ncbi:MAG: universal stress protein [Calditrichaeota bacterium]|nr:MAG: universal stress protein [Calditrichota bacterium]